MALFAFRVHIGCVLKICSECDFSVFNHNSVTLSDTHVSWHRCVTLFTRRRQDGVRRVFARSPGKSRVCFRASQQKPHCASSQRQSCRLSRGHNARHYRQTVAAAAAAATIPSHLPGTPRPPLPFSIRFAANLVGLADTVTAYPLIAGRFVVSTGDKQRHCAARPRGAVYQRLSH